MMYYYAFHYPHISGRSVNGTWNEREAKAWLKRHPDCYYEVKVSETKTVRTMYGAKCKVRK